ncbi:hypothetical protein NKW54_12305 [Acetobacter cerevisiae]|uniref:Uncharacterized protein n=1 Tax=Acetobacter cerevisiae TaxID=178900 RepID=A0ABT1EU56_9PROT|nr:hypothetical protein [Acetobacter cerevisiae]
MNDSQTNVFLAQCTIEHAATNKEHQAALLLLSSPGGVCGEVTPERMQRGDLAFSEIKDGSGKDVPVIRSSGALYALRKSGTLTDAQVTAAELWARDYETGVLGGRDPEAGTGSGCPDPEYALLSRVAASSRCSWVNERIGKCGVSLMISLMIDGLSVSAISTQEEKPRARISGMIEFLLDQVAEAYSSMPGKMWFSKK